MTTTPTSPAASSTPPTPGQPRIAGAPISWGVCEVPDWGYQLAPGRVLEEMHQPGHDPLPAIDRILEQYQATRAEVLVLSATSGLDGYDSRPALDNDGWNLLLRNLNRISDRAAERGVSAVLHPHVGTMVENGDDVQRVLGGSSVSLCLDTGHLLIGGTDPADLTRQAPDRIAHTHLKDVNSQIADKVRAGRLSYTEAVVGGMYRPLGTGDVDVEAIVNTLQGNGYTGWYTLEQDTILTEEPRGEGPVTDVRTSADYVSSLLATTAATSGATTR
jgi:inosose dehydratase